MSKKAQFTRPNWDEYFMNIAHVVKTRSNCSAGKIGALTVRDRRIIATGYNGTPMNIQNCFEGSCARCAKRLTGELKSGEAHGECICLHAEQNALLQSAYHGVSTKGGTLYTTATPCRLCSKMIINAGIVRVVADEKYADAMGRELLNSAGIELITFAR